jgi:hypothetical protein
MRGKHHKKWLETTIRVGGVCVTESTPEKLLGVTVSNNLKWKDHHQQLVSSLRHRVFVIRRLVQNLPRQITVGLLDVACSLLCEVLLATLWVHETE